MSHFDGTHYNKTAVLQFQQASQLISKYAAHFDPVDSVLDVGCGDGKVTALLKEHFPNADILGLDPSTSMIEFAKKHYENASLHFREGTIETFAEKAKFDLIVSFSALQWTTLDIAFKRIATALKPKGHCLLMYHACNDLVWMPIDIVCKRSAWLPYFENFTHDYHFYDIDGSILLAEAAGLKLIHAAAPWYQLPLKDLEAYKSALSSFLPHLNVLPNESLKKQFLAEISEEFKLFSHQNADGYWLVPGRTIEIVATVK